MSQNQNRWMGTQSVVEHLLFVDMFSLPDSFKARKQIQEKDVEVLRGKLAHARPEFINYREAIARIIGLVARLEGMVVFANSNSAFPLYCYVTALKAQALWLYFSNDEYMSVEVPWDTIGFPSHPSMSADVAAYAKRDELEEVCVAFLNSFSAWTSVKRETLSQCSCGRRSRPVEIDIMVNHSLSVTLEGICIRQYIGVASDDMAHLKNHYSAPMAHPDSVRQSTQSEHLVIVGMRENTITLGTQDTYDFVRTHTQANELNFSACIEYLRAAIVPLDGQFASLKQELALCASAGGVG